MTRPIGFSTGALALSDFRRGLAMSRDGMQSGLGLSAIELSALRQAELGPLLDSLHELDLKDFAYVSIHAPSRMDESFERVAAERLVAEAWRKRPIILHPDAIRNLSSWRPLGPLLCIENMDNRKPIGRSLDELRRTFDELPEASFCFDIGHARQFDSTMAESSRILRELGSRLRQVHISEVNSEGKHDRLSRASIKAFRKVADLIPADVPLILETPVDQERMRDEFLAAIEALPLSVEASAHG